MPDGPILLWLRRDLRLADAPALSDAAAVGRPVLPVFIRDASVDRLGAAPKWRLGLGLRHFAGRLDGIGSRLVFRSGEAVAVLKALADETGASAIWWSRLYDGASVARDTAVKSWAKSAGIEARSFNSHLLHEPWEITTGGGTPYRVFTPFWRAMRGMEVPEPLPEVDELRSITDWPESEDPEDWPLRSDMNRGAAVVARHIHVGEAAALTRLSRFLDAKAAEYVRQRDLLAEDGTSGLSENLTYGEISPRTVWHAASSALRDGVAGAETFLKELAWREFAWHLFHARPDMDHANWRSDWDAFPWRKDNADAESWRRGRTGVPVVDAAMREMYVTGRMHNRARMIAASWLTKHLLTDWRIGLDWFGDCLIDWDPASNALGWQWVAGSGPDASPFFRVFNPATQAEKFDPDGTYRRRWIAEGHERPTATALSFFDAIPRRWGLTPEDRYPDPPDLAEGRRRALQAYARVRP